MRRPDRPRASGEQLWAADGPIPRAIGAGLSHVRTQRGLSRQQVTERTLFDLTGRALTSYEHGERQCDLPRLVRLCLVLDLDPVQHLRLALQHSPIGVEHTGLLVDLTTIARDTRPELTRLRHWAQRRLQHRPPHSTVVHLPYHAIQEMAVLLDYTECDLVALLAGFAPDAAHDELRATHPAASGRRYDALTLLSIADPR